VKPAAPPPWKNIAAWQYTSGAHVGAYGPVDETRTYSSAVLAHPRQATAAV
jgi:hypothetical protein